MREILRRFDVASMYVGFEDAECLSWLEAPDFDVTNAVLSM